MLNHSVYTHSIGNGVLPRDIRISVTESLRYVKLIKACSSLTNPHYFNSAFVCSGPT